MKKYTLREYLDQVQVNWTYALFLENKSVLG